MNATTTPIAACPDCNRGLPASETPTVRFVDVESVRAALQGDVACMRTHQAADLASAEWEEIRHWPTTAGGLRFRAEAYRRCANLIEKTIARILKGA